MSLAQAAHQFDFIHTSAKETAKQRLQAFEQGERKPTRNQLLKFASRYRRPVLVFYLQEPPKKGRRGEDFRRATNKMSQRDNALLDALIRETKVRQELVKSLLEDEDVPNLSFVGSANLKQGAKTVAESIATTLEFDYQQSSTRHGNADDLFTTLRTKAESCGIFISLVGDMGSYHSAFRTDLFRGFVLSDQVAPFVVINDQDARPARSFTLVHELAHIWLDRSGISGQPSPDTPQSQYDRIEQFCNDVAGELLLPSSALRTQSTESFARDVDDATAVIREFAKQWRVSESMVAYRLHRANLVETKVYRNLIASYSARWRRHKQEQREKNNDRNPGGPDPHVTKRSKLGNELVDVVYRNVREDTLTDTKAAMILGIKPGSVEPFLRKYEIQHSSIIRPREPNQDCGFFLQSRNKI